MVSSLINPRVPTESRAQIVQSKKKNKKTEQERKKFNAVPSNLHDAWSLYKTPGFQKEKKKKQKKEQEKSQKKRQWVVPNQTRTAVG